MELGSIIIVSVIALVVIIFVVKGFKIIPRQNTDGILVQELGKSSARARQELGKSSAIIQRMIS